MRYILMFLGFAILSMRVNVCTADDYDYDYDDQYDYEDFANNIDNDASDAQYSIQVANDTDIECSVNNVSINPGESSVAVNTFDIAGIMLGMNFEDAQFAAKTSGLYDNRQQNSVVYSIHPEWKANLDYECRRGNIFVPSELEKCINSLARSRGVLYASELHLVRKSTGETIDVFFTSNATDNVVWKIVYKNDAGEYEGNAEQFENQRNKKILTWWQSVLDKYGVPNAGGDKWATSDNAYDPMMTAYYGELDLIDCGLHAEDSSMNIQQSQSNFAAKPYAF